MSNKERFLEVFSKVNKLPLNEEVNYESEEMEIFEDKVSDNIKDALRGMGMHMFSEGVPGVLIAETFDYGDLELRRREEQGVEEWDRSEGVVTYHAIYYVKVTDVPFEVKIEFEVTSQQREVSNVIEFYSSLLLTNMPFEVRIFK